jgi:hypothetical protein
MQMHPTWANWFVNHYSNEAGNDNLLCTLFSNSQIVDAFGFKVALGHLLALLFFD